MVAGPSAGGRTLLFVPGESPLHRLNPLTKLTGLLWLAATVFMLPPHGTAVVAAAALLVGTFAGAGAVFAKRLILTLGPLAVALFVVHGLLVDHGNRSQVLGLDVSRDGLAYLYRVLARVAALLSGSLLFVTTTHPSRLLKALDAHGVSPGLAYLIASPLLLIDPFTARARAIRDAQSARGLDLSGSLRARVRAFPALLLPLVTLAVADIDNRAAVLDGRGFRAFPRRTVLDAPADGPSDRLLRRAFLVLIPLQLAAVLLWR